MFARCLKAVELAQRSIALMVFVVFFLGAGAVAGVIFAVGTLSGLYATTQLARRCDDAANDLRGGFSGVSDVITCSVSVIVLALAWIPGTWLICLYLAEPWQAAAYRHPFLHVSMIEICGFEVFLGAAMAQLLLLLSVLCAWSLKRAIKQRSSLNTTALT